MSDKKETTAVEQEAPICFVIMPFSDPDGYEKGHFKKIYEQIFKPAIEMAGFVAHRVDENSESTLIQAKIYDELINAPMVLCDLSVKNPNVLYELGIRHAFDKPVVLVQEAGQSRIFDIAGVGTVDYRKERHYDEVLEDQKSIANALVETADTEKSYSFMKLVNLMPASIEKHNSQITSEERIEILLQDLAQKVNKIEKRIGFSTVNSNVVYSSKVNTDTPSKTMCKYNLSKKICDAENLIDQLRSGKGNVESRELLETCAALQCALEEYRTFACESDESTNRALDRLHDLVVELNKI